eukprot:m.292236 g.292236  ORF g.292236 m.292236 type:complete len:464 (+) comp12593_c0_seq1:265-1656(+)
MGGNESRMRRQVSQSFLSSPITTKETHTGEANGMRYGVSCMQGWRSHMEDAHIMQGELPGLQDWALFSVLDGHAGEVVAQHSAKQLPAAVLFETLPARDSLQGVEKGLRRAFLRHDRDMQKNFDVLRDRSGSTCTSVLVSPTHFFIANCGDSRVVLCRNGRLFFSTRDHKPTNTVELERIIRAGGVVLNGRVDGGLAVSRALGDFDYKQRTDLDPAQQKVSAEPDTTVIPRAPGQDDFLILACDGIWDVLTCQSAIKFVQGRLKRGEAPGIVCEKLIRRCLELGSRDNMSALVVLFDSDSKPPARADESREQVVDRIATSVAYSAVAIGLEAAIGPRGTSILRRPTMVGLDVPRSPAAPGQPQTPASGPAPAPAPVQAQGPVSVTMTSATEIVATASADGATQLTATSVSVTVASANSNNEKEDLEDIAEEVAPVAPAEAPQPVEPAAPAEESKSATSQTVAL